MLRAMHSDSGDGYFDLYYSDGWAFLEVHPARDGGNGIYIDDVRNRMRMLGIPTVDPAIIRQIINEASGVGERLVEWPEGEQLASRIEVEISRDQMSASITMTPPRKGALPPSVADVERELERAGVVRGIDEDAIRQAVLARRYNESVHVADGQKPEDAKAATIRYHFNPDRGKPYLTMEFDRINLRELNFIEYVEAGSLLAELLPPVDAVDGYTVTGETLLASQDAAPDQFRGGMNTALSEEQDRIVATADGNVRIKDGTIIVEPVVTVKNVDYSTGNIHFEGSVVVEGSIADGFVVDADGDVQVAHGVGRATITCGGNLLLQTGINGSHEGRISCRGNVVAKYIESAEVKCEGHLLVEEAVMHSEVVVWGHCMLSGRRSEIIASHLVVGGSLWCKKLGSVAEAPVEIRVGMPPSVVQAHDVAKLRLSEQTERRDLISHQIEQLTKLVADGRGNQKIETALEQLSAEQEELHTAVRESRHSVHELRERLQAASESMVVVEDTIFKNAYVVFGNVEYRAPDRGDRQTILRTRGPNLINEGFSRAHPPELVFEPEESIRSEA
jgi:uncharacterized protein (DUF342 family)